MQLKESLENKNN